MADTNVFAVEVEMEHWGDDRGGFHERPFIFESRRAASMAHSDYLKWGYPAATLVEFRLVPVEEEA